jgi:hypothetical protein
MVSCVAVALSLLVLALVGQQQGAQATLFAGEPTERMLLIVGDVTHETARVLYEVRPPPGPLCEHLLAF